MNDKTTYSYEEAYSASLAYFGGDELAARVWVNKYAMKDSFGNIYEKSPADMHWRIANEVARIEQKYENPISAEQVFELLDHFRYVVPAGSPMTGIGNDHQVASLSNCFVIGLDGEADSYGAIMRIDEEQVQLMKRRGGVGHDLSHIRPKGSPVNNSALTSTGLVPFMERYSNSTREVAQDGRRGALMLSVSIKHPDSEAFIDAKMVEGKVTGANVSVKIDDGFMQCVVDDKPYTQQFPIDAEQPFVSKEISARKLWEKIVHNAWKSAEPGVLFWDTILRESIPDCYADLGFRTVSTNPCGEIPLCPYDSCRLLSINLYSYVEHPFTPDASFNYEKFAAHVQLAQRIMDDIVDLEMEKIDRIMEKIQSDPQSDEVKGAEYHLWEKIQRKSGMGRRTGVGITAEGDMLAAMGLRYGTQPATDFSVSVHKMLALNAYRSSVTMAKERGAFEIYDARREEANPFVCRLKEADPQLYEDMRQYGRRNIACLTIAPTGTTSLMTQTTSGIEPVFMPVYKRRRKVNPNDADVHVDYVDEVGDSFEEYIVYHRKFLEWMRVNGYDTEKRYTQEEIDALVARSPYYKATANDVDWLMKVRMQGAIQKWVDHSISVTVNLPNDVDEALVNKLYVEAWRSGCKGCTIYRDGSRSGVMIAVLVIFFILLFHFKRISLALVNLSSMSLCIFGAAVGLCITGYDVSLTCVLGVVSLMGILVRNGIIMIDYAEELRREKGLSVRDAAFQAGERRMRPIFLTSAAASVGVLPMMLENNTLWSPMGAVIFFGTLISMVLIATVLPILYWLVFDKHGKYSLRRKASAEHN